MLMTSACATLMNSATSKMTDNLTLAILNQSDLETVRSGAPAYLLMVDGLIQGSPGDSDLLLAGSKLYSSYTSAFIDDPERARRLSKKSFDYATRAVCADLERVCAAMESPTDEFRETVAGTRIKDLPLLYGLATAWTGWVQANSDDWNAVIDLPRLTLLFERCLELDEGFDGGGAHVYLGVFATLLPPSLGGKPEVARVHFERAIEISSGDNLMYQVLMAEHYARAVFDREMHDRLLRAVLAQPAEAPRLTLINTLAKRRAEILLAGSADFF
jgi:hypothetical protein